MSGADTKKVKSMWITGRLTDVDDHREYVSLSSVDQGGKKDDSIKYNSMDLIEIAATLAVCLSTNATASFQEFQSSLKLYVPDRESEKRVETHTYSSLNSQL